MDKENIIKVILDEAFGIGRAIPEWILAII